MDERPIQVDVASVINLSGGERTVWFFLWRQLSRGRRMPSGLSHETRPAKYPPVRAGEMDHPKYSGSVQIQTQSTMTTSKEQRMSEVHMNRMSWQEYGACDAIQGARFSAGGALEQHGPHLPLGTDALLATAIAAAAGRAHRAASWPGTGLWLQVAAQVWRRTAFPRHHQPRRGDSHRAGQRYGPGVREATAGAGGAGQWPLRESVFMIEGIDSGAA